jgi:hypothetical protein
LLVLSFSLFELTVQEVYHLGGGDRPTLKLQLDQVGFGAFSMTLQQLEARLASLEGDLAQVKLLLQQVLQGKAIELIQTEIPCWEKIAGTWFKEWVRRMQRRRSRSLWNIKLNS